MTDYQAPVPQMRFTIEHLADLAAVAALPDFSSVDGDTVQAVLEEAAKFAGGVLEGAVGHAGDCGAGHYFVRFSRGLRHSARRPRVWWILRCESKRSRRDRSALSLRITACRRCPVS